MAEEPFVLRSRSQRYAISALEQLSTYLAEDETTRTKYGSMAHTLPVLIRTAGLVQALTFVKARNEKPKLTLIDHIAKTIGQGDRDKLHEKALNAPLHQYMLLTTKVLDALLWYKRFAESVLGVKAGVEDREEDQ